MARVERWLKRIEATDRERTEYEDFLWAFFQNCWHLKDWIKNDGKLPATITGCVESDIRNYDSLKMCGDICNKSKHFELNRKPAIGATARGDIGVQVSDSLQGSETAATSSINYKIVLADGSERDALDVYPQDRGTRGAIAVDRELPRSSAEHTLARPGTREPYAR